jgi:hypothetical protein
MARYAITAKGLKRTKSVTVETGKLYWFGASSSPDIILVTATDENKFYYVRRYSAEWEEEPKVMRIEQRIGQDLIARAERTERKSAKEIRAQGYPWSERAAASSEALIGGLTYEYHHRMICNCCGDDFENLNENGRSECCGSDWRENKDASRLIGKTN